MKKPLISELLVFTFLAILLTGCAPAAQITAIPLELDDQKVLLGFQQNGVDIPISSIDNQWKVTLKPAAFTLIVNGDRKIVSVMALQSADLASPLLQSSKPWVAPLYTGNTFSANDLYLSNQPLHYYEVNSYTLQDLSFYSFPAEKAADMAKTVKNQLGTEPLMLLSSRTYLDTQSDQEQNYFVKTINGKTVQSGEGLVLLVFIEKQSNDPFFRVIKWLVFNLEFK